MIPTTPARRGTGCRLRLAAGAALAGIVAWGCASRPVTPPTVSPTLQTEPRIRVCLAEAVAQVELGFTGDVRLWADDGGALELHGSGALQLRVGDGMLLMQKDGNVLAQAQVRLGLESPDDGGRWRYGEALYRGSLQVLRVGDRLTLVNEIPLETYLCGVVPWEIGTRDPATRAAVEAQAIAARTYAYKRLGKYPEAGFDVYADVTDQVYQGSTRADSLADAAIRTTAGLVLWDNGAPIEAYYCSTCGGHTSRIEAVWDKPPQPALRGRRDAPPEGGSYCAASRHFRWSEAWSGAGLERTLQETLPRELGWPAGTAIGALADIRIAARDETGRVRELQVQTTQGTFRVLGDRIRWVLRPRDRAILRSTLFNLEVERQGGAIVRVFAYGGGNGHGVGMCQMGAIEMARRGFASADILTHYYLGAQLLRLY